MSASLPSEPGSFPIFLRLAGHRVVIVGGGDAAAAKVRLLLSSGAQLRVLADDACEELHALALSAQIELLKRAPVLSDFIGVRLCVVALEDEALAMAAVALAREAGVLVNAVDRPELSDFTVPAIVDRAPVTVAIGTDGASPALAQTLRARIEAAVPPGVSGFARLCREWRGRVRDALPDREVRRRFWQDVMHGEAAALAFDGDLADAETAIAKRLAATQRGLNLRSQGRASLVGAGPGDPELLTLRAVRALKSADVIMYDALVDPAVLDLARRDARRIDVGKRCGRHAMSQAAINRLILENARRGAHVVRLKGGDPFVFGRGGEELDCLSAAGVPVEVIPGVTAACAAAARLGIPLTHREIARSLHFVTGHGSDGAVPHLDWRALAGGEGTIAAYMASRTLPIVAARLIEAGLPRATPAVAVENASRPNERHLWGTLAELPAAMTAQNFDGPTLVLIGKVVELARSATAMEHRAA